MHDNVLHLTGQDTALSNKKPFKTSSGVKMKKNCHVHVGTNHHSPNVINEPVTHLIIKAYNSN